MFEVQETELEWLTCSPDVISSAYLNTSDENGFIRCGT